MVHTNNRPRAYTRKHTPCVPPCRSVGPAGWPAGRLAGPVCLSLRRFPIVSPRRRGRARARSPLLRCTLGGATRRPRCIPRETSARHRLYRASLPSVCVTGLSNFSLSLTRSFLFSLRSSSHIHTHTSFPLSLSLSPPLHLQFRVFLSSLSSSLRVRRRGKRLPGRLALIPSARRRLLFFRLFVLASSRAGNRRRLRRRLPASRLSPAS